MQLIESYQPEYVARFVALQETCNCPKCKPSPSQGREPFGDVCKILDLLLPLRRGEAGRGVASRNTRHEFISPPPEHSSCEKFI